MTQAALSAYRVLAVLVVLGVAWAVLVGAGTRPARADVTAVTGSGYGYWAEVSLFGGAPQARGPEPTVELAPDASNSPQEASIPEGAAVFGPATVFRSLQIDVRSEGALGAGGSVTTSTHVQADVAAERGDAQRRPGPLYFDAFESTCTADEGGVTAGTTVANGEVVTSYDPDSQLPETMEQVPVNPPPGFAIEGTIDHVGDRFRIVFNEQVENPDGSTTVNAAHMYLLGDIAVGDVIIGQSTCGVDATPADTAAPPDTTTTTTTEPPTTTTTEPETATTTTEPDDLDTEATADEGAGVPIAALAVGALVLIAVAVAVVLARRSRATPAD